MKGVKRPKRIAKKEIDISNNHSCQKVPENIEDFSRKSCFINDFCQDEERLNSVIVNVSSIMSKYKMVRKEKSPSLSCIFNESILLCLIDEGSEINCISNDFVLKNAIPVVDVKCKAVGAGKSPMNVVGMTKYDIIVTVVGPRVPVKINLGQMVVIQNLGTDALLTDINRFI